MNLANKLTTIRIFLVPVMILFFYFNMPVIAAIVFFIAAMTDILDGKIARKRDMVTTFGKFFDPIADKLITISAFILITVAVPDASVLLRIFYALFTIVIISRELMVTSFRALAIGEGVVIAADKWGKLKTTFQDIAVICLFINMHKFNIWIFDDVLFYVSNIVLVISVILTIFSGVNYLTSNKEVLDRIKENI